MSGLRFVAERIEGVHERYPSMARWPGYRAKREFPPWSRPVPCGRQQRGTMRTMTDDKNNHRRRAKPDLEGTPTPEQIKAAREAAGLDMAQAAAVVLHTAEQWGAWESGARRLHPIIWWAFQQRVATLSEG